MNCPALHGEVPKPRQHLAVQIEWRWSQIRASALGIAEPDSPTGPCVWVDIEAGGRAVLTTGFECPWGSTPEYGDSTVGDIAQPSYQWRYYGRY